MIDALEARNRYAQEMLLSDERLRGDLTDDQFQAVLDQAMPLLDKAVQATATIEDETAAQEAIADWLRNLRRALHTATDPEATPEPGSPFASLVGNLREKIADEQEA